MASTVVIFSGCTKKDAEKNVKRDVKEEIRVGVTSDLLSFDPFSFQSLGEKDIRDLIYAKVFETSEEGIKSDYLKNIKISKNKVTFDKLDPSIYKKVDRVFKKGKASTLWKDTFKHFDFYKDKIVYKKEKDFIPQLRTLESLLLVEGAGEFKVEAHIKGQSLKLLGQKNSLNRRLIIKRIKNDKTGLDLLQSKKIDVYFPGGLFAKGVLDKYKDLNVVYSSNELLKLRMYYKYKEANPISVIFCANKKEIVKIIGAKWDLEKDSCLEEAKPKNLKVVYSDSYGLKILDFLFDQYQKKVGKTFKYDQLRSTDLTKALKMGQFDHHLSLEKISFSTPILSDSFHSRGNYNTYRLKDKSLDALLDESSRQTDLKGFYRIQQSLKKKFFEVLPVTFSYTRPSISYIKRKDSNVFSAKSSKRLIFLKK